MTTDQALRVLRGEITQLATAAAQACYDAKRELRQRDVPLAEYDALVSGLRAPALEALMVLSEALNNGRPDDQS